MNREEADLIQQASAVTLTFLRDDEEGHTLLLSDLDKEPRKADGFVLLAIVVATTVAEYTQQSISEVWSDLGAPSTVWPTEIVNRGAVVALAEAVRTGDQAAVLSASASLGDVATALGSGFDLLLAALERLAMVTGDTAEAWLSRYAVETAAGHGVTD